MKWFNKTAQGYSPGKCKRKFRPERAADMRGLSFRQSPLLLQWQRPDSVPLSGRDPVGAFPRTKALGCSVSTFRAADVSRGTTEPVTTEGHHGHEEGSSIEAFPFCQGTRAKIWRRKVPASCRKRQL